MTDEEDYIRRRVKWVGDLESLSIPFNGTSTIRKRLNGNSGAKKRSLWNKMKSPKICYLCEIPLVSIRNASIDHVIPLSRGGSNRVSNLRLTHIGCNNKKGSKLVSEYEN